MYRSKIWTRLYLAVCDGEDVHSHCPVVTLLHCVHSNFMLEYISLSSNLMNPLNSIVHKDTRLPKERFLFQLSKAARQCNYTTYAEYLHAILYFFYSVQNQVILLNLALLVGLFDFTDVSTSLIESLFFQIVDIISIHRYKCFQNVFTYVLIRF